MILLIIISICCSKEDAVIPEFSIDEFKTYCYSGNADCGTPLSHEGEKVKVIGYVHALNTFPTSSRFHMFDSSSMLTSRLEIKVSKNENEIFKKLYTCIDTSDYMSFSKFEVTGIIEGTDLPINDNCKRGAFIVLSNENEIN